VVFLHFDAVTPGVLPSPSRREEQAMAAARRPPSMSTGEGPLLPPPPRLDSEPVQRLDGEPLLPPPPLTRVARIFFEYPSSAARSSSAPRPVFSNSRFAQPELLRWRRFHSAPLPATTPFPGSFPTRGLLHPGMGTGGASAALPLGARLLSAPVREGHQHKESPNRPLHRRTGWMALVAASAAGAAYAPCSANPLRQCTSGGGLPGGLHVRDVAALARVAGAVACAAPGAAPAEAGGLGTNGSSGCGSGSGGVGLRMALPAVLVEGLCGGFLGGAVARKQRRVLGTRTDGKQSPHTISNAPASAPQC